MGDYLPHQIYELPNNEWKEKYQVVYGLPKVDDIYKIREDGNDDSYNGFVGYEVQLTDGSGNPWFVNINKAQEGNQCRYNSFISQKTIS